MALHQSVLAGKALWQKYHIADDSYFDEPANKNLLGDTTIEYMICLDAEINFKSVGANRN